MFSHEPLYMDAQLLDDQLEIIYKRSVGTQDVAWKTFRKRWMIETVDERESRKSKQHNMMMIYNILFQV